MKRSEFIKHLIKSFGGEQQFADELKNTLTDTEYSTGDNDRWQLWGTILSMLETESRDPFSAMFSGIASIKRQADESAIEAAIREFKGSKQCAMLGEQGPRVIDQFHVWLKETYLSDKEEVAA